MRSLLKHRSGKSVSNGSCRFSPRIEALERRELLSADPGWGFAFNGPTVQSDSEVNLGPDGNLYVTGSFRGTVDFDPGPGAAQFTTFENAQDGFVAKYTPQGGLIWATTFGATIGHVGHEFSNDIEFDAAGNVYIVGHSNSEAPQFGAFTLDNQGSYDAFVAKLDAASGDFAWAKNFGGPLQETAYDIDVSPAGDVYVAGTFGGTVDFDPDAGSVHNVSSAGDQDAFFLKLDANGSFQWVRAFGGPSLNNGHRMVRGDDGFVYAAGTFRETTDFGTAENPLVLEDASPGVSNLFFLKLNELAGDPVWARQVDGPGRVASTRLAADGMGNLFLGGLFEDSINFGAGTTVLTSAGGEDGFLSRWDSDGNFVWGNALASGSADISVGTLTLDPSGSPLMSFGFEGTADFETGAGTANLTSVDQMDGAVVKLNADGSFGSVRQISGPGVTEAHGLVEDSAGNIYVSGFFQDSVTLTTGDTLTAAGNGTFVNKIAPIAPTKFFVVDADADETNEYDSLGNRQDLTSLAAGNTNPRGAASNIAGDRVWVVDANKKVYVYDAAGALLGSWTANGLKSPQGVATNGTDVWIVDSSTDRVYKYNGAAGRLSGSQNAASNFRLNSQNRNPTDLVTGGSHIWVVNSAAADRVFKYTLSGSLLGSWTIDSRNTSPTGITLDPASPSTLWIVDNAADQVFAYVGATSRTSGSQSATVAVNLGAGNTDPQGIADPPPAAIADEMFAEFVESHKSDHDAFPFTIAAAPQGDRVTHLHYTDPAEIELDLNTLRRTRVLDNSANQALVYDAVGTPAFIGGAVSSSANAAVDPGPGTANLTSAGSGDFFVAKLTQTGVLAATAESRSTGLRLATEPTRRLRSAAVDRALAVHDNGDVTTWGHSLDDELLLTLVSR